MNRKIICLVAIIIFIAGCVPTFQYISSPERQTIKNDLYEASILPCGRYRFSSFILSISNKTDKNIEIIWDKTMFISGGITNGGFMFEGVIYKDRNNPKPPDVVFANGRFVKTIYPNNLVYFSGGRYGAGWGHDSMSIGENGIYLTLKIDGKEISEKLTVDFKKVPLEQSNTAKSGFPPPRE